MSSNNNKSKLILSILVIILILVIGFFVQFNNNISNLYENIGIDNSKLNILFLDVGQGDCTLITINGHTMLIDAGNDSDGYYITQFLKSQDIHRIDYLIGIHIDEDHIGGLDEVIEEFEIGNLYIPQNIRTNEKIYKNIEEAVYNKDGLKINEKEQGYTFNLGDAECKILSDKDIDVKNANETSIIIQMSYGNKKYLFMGDATERIEKTIEFEKIDVLKVGHHASNSSTSQKFLEQIVPIYSIISMGNSNSYNLPNDNVLQRLQAIGTKIYRTDKDGTIWIKSDGDTIKIKTLDINLDGANRKVSIVKNYNNTLYYCLGT